MGNEEQKNTAESHGTTKLLNDAGLKPQKTIETFSYNGSKKKNKVNVNVCA